MSAQREDAGRSTIGWTAALLLGSYPPWWRLRYDDEMRDTVLALREEGHWNAASTRDLLRGVVEAWLVPMQAPSGDDALEARRRLMPFTAWGLLIFVLAGSAFAKVLEDPVVVGGGAHSVLSWSVTILTVAAIAAAAVMATASMFSLAAVLRSDPRSPWRTLAPLLVAPASVGAFALTLVVAKVLADVGPPHDVRHVLAFLALALVMVVGGVATTIAVMRVAMQVPDTRGVAATERIATVGVAVLTSLAAAAALAWTLVAAAESPQFLHSQDGLLGTPTSISVVTTLVGLVAAALLCDRSAVAIVRR